MIPTQLFRICAALPRSESPKAGVGLGGHDGQLCEAAAGFRLCRLPRSLTLPSLVASGSILRSRLMVCFLLLSVVDLLLTGWLLVGEGPFFEANPLAAWCLQRFGWGGLAGLKAASLLLTAAGIAVLARRRPWIARGILAVGCLAVALVVFQGASLVTASPALQEEYHREQAFQVRADAEARQLQNLLELQRNYSELRRRLSRELLAGRRSLASALAELERLGFHRHPHWRRLADGLHPGKSSREILERQLLDQLLVDIQEGVPEGLRLLARLWPIKFRGPSRRSERYPDSGQPVQPPSRPW